MDLRPFMNPNPYTVNEVGPVSHMFKIIFKENVSLKILYWMKLVSSVSIL